MSADRLGEIWGRSSRTTAYIGLDAQARSDVAWLIGEVERLTAEREVGEPPAPGETPHTYTKPAHGWTCFHCGETFKTIGGARDHFGAAPTAMPGCMARVAYGDERGLEMALREAEAALATAGAAGFARGVEAAAEWCEASRAELSALDDLSWYDDGRQAAFGLARDAIRALVPS